MLMYVDMDWVESDFQQNVIGYGFFYGGLGQASAQYFSSCMPECCRLTSLLTRNFLLRLLQLLVAIFELQKGSSFSFAVFGSYGAFWLGWALVALENENRETPDFDGVYKNGKAAYLAQVRALFRENFDTAKALTKFSVNRSHYSGAS